MTIDHKVNIFFYSSYMSFDIQKTFGVNDQHYQVVQLPSYELTIGSAANVIPNGLERTFGIVTQLTHDEIEALYGREA